MTDSTLATTQVIARAFIHEARVARLSDTEDDIDPEALAALTGDGNPTGTHLVINCGWQLLTADGDLPHEVKILGHALARAMAKILAQSDDPAENEAFFKKSFALTSRLSPTGEKEAEYLYIISQEIAEELTRLSPSLLIALLENYAIRNSVPEARESLFLTEAEESAARGFRPTPLTWLQRQLQSRKPIQIKEDYVCVDYSLLNADQRVAVDKLMNNLEESGGSVRFTLEDGNRKTAYMHKDQQVYIKGKEQLFGIAEIFGLFIAASLPREMLR